MASRSATNLDHLPTEILEQILFSITDLRSIYHLVTASPTASRVFESSEVGPKALDHALAASMSPHVVELVRRVGLVRTVTPENSLASSLRDFAERYTQCQGGKDSSLNLAAPSLARSLRGQPPQLVRGILLTARRICCLAWACLEHYRGQWSSVTPAHLERGFAWGAGGEKPWRQVPPPGKPYKLQPVGPPCWMEEQRVMRGFWRLQLLIDLKLAVSEGRVDWALEDSQREMSPEILFAGWTWQKEEFLTVVDFVDRVQGGPVLTQGSQRLQAPPPGCKSAKKWQDPALPGVVDPRWSREEISKGRPPCWTFYIVRLLRNPFSPIRGVPFWPYRQLGLVIWDEDKLEALELSYKPYASRGSKLPTSSSDQVFTWRSLLSQELIAELQRNMEENFQKNGFRFMPSDNPDM
ncbi:hypothetical protein CH063_02711 [Colletotrichum higginsianum]|uniref:F-box domain-containing protein n=2 Tax=Colletotrichum higginsianum TaxID=80884 RepID=H1VNW4_COLHI|nr:hypothetical protein CH63R_13664 [Colletotrichum higginsianum IMI 349063]OBR02438.1 hypothetical protein CH63R_13664 [Colletotrichum higginsianum IMI 349063]TID07603.1 hypothetical protein CH35J_000192 [Colletotrichum higginsianum]CCF41918.1 hypothetical protein CH063_02711 [Colletotrichum higginsianum]